MLIPKLGCVASFGVSDIEPSGEVVHNVLTNRSISPCSVRYLSRPSIGLPYGNCSSASSLTFANFIEPVVVITFQSKFAKLPLMIVIRFAKLS